MRFYATMQGHVTCPTLESFQALCHELEKGGWLDEEGFVVDECEERISAGPDADESTLTLRIPLGTHRNLSRILSACFAIKEYPGRTGRIVGTSTDGCFIGWVDGPEGVKRPEESLDLYADNTDKPDVDKDFSDYCEWQAEAEQFYHKQHGA